MEYKYWGLMYKYNEWNEGKGLQREYINRIRKYVSMILKQNRRKFKKLNQILFKKNNRI